VWQKDEKVLSLPFYFGGCPDWVQAPHGPSIELSISRIHQRPGLGLAVGFRYTDTATDSESDWNSDPQPSGSGRHWNAARAVDIASGRQRYRRVVDGLRLFTLQRVQRRSKVLLRRPQPAPYPVTPKKHLLPPSAKKKWTPSTRNAPAAISWASLWVRLCDSLLMSRGSTRPSRRFCFCSFCWH